MADAVAATNAKIAGFFSGVNGGGFATFLGWVIFIIISVAGLWWVYIYYKNKKLFNKKITVFEIVGINFVPSIRDVAKTVKIGSGGFEILWLKKLKVHRIAYGGRVGRDTYYFFIQPDGYWINGMLSANMNAIDKNGGLIPVVTTNPNMRSQYTSLEKQIDALHKAKASFMDKYGGWVLAISFVLVSGVMLYLMFREFSTAMRSMSALVDRLTQTASSVCNGGTSQSGLIQVK